jgi:basic membrane lipoprotein Med (substrate-binding protein (PBP1-ABC) superfamily)
MERALGARVRTIAVESVAEGADAERVMRDLVAQQGASLVFATSFGYLEPALRVAADFPQARFEHAGGYKGAPNLATYDARYYEARWLAGWLAGRASTTGVAGYVAGFPVPEVVQGINAFTLGMRAANPKATVRVVWLDTWFDPGKERDAAQTLIDQGADVLTHHSASTAVAQAAQANFRARGVRVVSYPSDMRAFALGMRAANPRAQVRVLWLDTWFDPGKERDAAQTLIDRGADVLSNHSASPAVAQTAQANFASRGVRLIGYTSDMRRFAPDAQAAAIVHDWGGFYTRVAQSVIDGSWRPTPLWGGIASGMVDIAAVDPKLPAALRADLATRRGAIVAGTFKPFTAPLVDNAGTPRLRQGTLDDAAIARMDWFVGGVVGRLPTAPR